MARMPNPTSTRDRIVRAASRLFAERGYGATSLSDVAESCGVLKGNLAYYFKTKPDLLDAVMQDRQDRLWEALVHGAEPDAPPRAMIGRLLEHVRTTADDLARFGCPFGSLSTELGKSAAAVPDGGRSLVALQDFLKAQLAKVMPAVEAHLLALLQGAAVVSHAHRDPQVTQRLVDAAEEWLDRLFEQSGEG
jgi:TetR/AcrR family transcriptional repressor of nem operon